MADSFQMKVKGRSLTRRSLLIAVPSIVLAGGGYSAAVFNQRADTPILLGKLGPFRKVFLTPRDDQSQLDATIAYPFGERHNPYDEGLAHFLEHLAWQNVRSFGIDGGRHSNAWTSPQATLYSLSRPADELEKTIKRLAASAAELVVDESRAIKERKIVQREFDLRRLENPLDASNVEMGNKLFGDSAYARQTLGSKSSIDRFTLEAAQKLHDQTHQLSHATLHLRGPIRERDVRWAIDAIDSWPTPRSEPLPETLPLWPEAPHDVRKITVHGLAHPRFVQHKSFLPPPDFDWAEVFAARNILVNLALSTKPGSIARPLRYDAFLAASFDLGITPLATGGLVFWVDAEPDKNVSLSDLNGALDQQFERLFGSPNKTSFEEIRERELSWLDGILDPLKVNDQRLFDALISGAEYVPLAELRVASQNMSFTRFKSFTQHFLSPRTSVSRLIYVS